MMSKLSDVQKKKIEYFLDHSSFPEKSACIIDLDGTVLIESNNKIVFPDSVREGILALRKVGVTIILNTLRFPLSVIQAVIKDLYDLIGTEIPLIALNGSLVGRFSLKENNFYFNEDICYTLLDSEIDAMLTGVKELINADIKKIIVFFYPRDWQQGEIIWTNSEEHIAYIQKKYVSASRIFSSSLEELSQKMKAAHTCMVLLLIDADENTLMAYQHTKKNMYFVKSGIDKRSGLLSAAKLFDIFLQNSIGAGDTELDNFLSITGFSIQAGKGAQAFNGIVETIEATHPSEVGEYLKTIAELYGKDEDR